MSYQQLGTCDMHKKSWDCPRVNITPDMPEGNVHSEKLSLITRKTILEINQLFFAILLSQLDLGKIDMWKMYRVFV